MTGALWLQDLLRGTFTRLATVVDTFGVFPLWTPDGKRVVFKAARDLEWLAVDRGDERGVLAGSGAMDFPNAVAPAGETLAFMRMRPGNGGDIFTMPLRGRGEPHPVLETPNYEGGAQFSPDGLFLAYASDETRQLEVYVRPFPGPDRRWQVSTRGGRQARWSPTGREIFYRTDDKMMAVGVDVRGPELTLAAPRVLFEDRYPFGNNITAANYDVNADGQGFVMIEEEERARGLTVVLDWFEELRRTAPVPAR